MEQKLKEEKKKESEASDTMKAWAEARSNQIDKSKARYLQNGETSQSNQNQTSSTKQQNNEQIKASSAKTNGILNGNTIQNGKSASTQTTKNNPGHSSTTNTSGKSEISRSSSATLITTEEALRSGKLTTEDRRYLENPFPTLARTPEEAEALIRQQLKEEYMMSLQKDPPANMSDALARIPTKGDPAMDPYRRPVIVSVTFFIQKIQKKIIFLLLNLKANIKCKIISFD